MRQTPTFFIEILISKKQNITKLFHFQLKDNEKIYSLFKKFIYSLDELKTKELITKNATQSMDKKQAGHRQIGTEKEMEEILKEIEEYATKKTEYISKKITREDIKKDKFCLYVYGDNDLRKGYGGAAAVARNEPNSIGIRTKKLPSMEKSAFYTDVELEENKEKIKEDIEKVKIKGKEFDAIKIFPLGEGLADLKKTAPLTYNFLQKEIKAHFPNLVKKQKKIKSISV